MRSVFSLGALVLGLGLALGAAPVETEAAPNRVFRFQAEWRVNPDGTQCDKKHSVLNLSSSQADVDVVFFVYQFNPAPCDPSSPLQIIQGSGTVSVLGNQNHLRVVGTIFTSDDRPVEIDLELRRTGNLPDPGPDEKLWSAVARGEVVLDGRDLTRGKPSTTGQISRSSS